MEIKKYNYKNFPVVVEMSEHMGITFSAYSHHLSSEHRKEHINGGWEKPNEAIESIEKVIDKFLQSAPKNYKELADHIHGSLIWTGYEDCYVEPKILKIIVENFILTRNNEKNK